MVFPDKYSAQDFSSLSSFLTVIDTCIRHGLGSSQLRLCYGSAWPIMGVPPSDPGCWSLTGNRLPPMTRLGSSAGW